MARTDIEAWEATQRQRLRDQVDLVTQGNRTGVVVGTAGGYEDLAVMLVPDVVLVETKDQDTFQSLLTKRSGPFVRGGKPTRPVTPIAGLQLHKLPKLKRKRDNSFLDALEVLEDELPGVASPEYYLHVSADHGRPCPATEPEETGLSGPWPDRTNVTGAGANVKVTVVDTGWYVEAKRHPWLADGVDGDLEVIGQNLHAYSGHGAFVAGVVRCRAPKVEIRHERFRVLQGGAVRETAIIRQLRQAIRNHDGDPRAHVINLSAGSHALNRTELRSFKVLWDTVLSSRPDTVLVAAAGNDATDYPFYPAAFDWAVGVGSLDRKGGVSNFSNHGVNADVYAVGRNHVNAYPDGRYECKETPDKEDVRVFRTGLARWSGTSFAAPLVAGLLAAQIGTRPAGVTATQVKDAFVAGIPQNQDPFYGRIRRILNYA